ncbi:MAG TPA: hypothetical protein VKM54_12975 [Myxococcota bacterium]|nr:hypothetical protein [Myxococcota bacterium]
MRKLLIGMLCILVLGSQPERANGVVLQLPPEDQQAIAAKLGSGVVGKALPSEPIQDPSVYFPLRDKALVYQVTSGSNTGNTQTLSLAKARRPSGKPAWRFQLAPSLQAFIRQTPEGDLVMPAVSDLTEGVVVVNTPANPFVMTGMKPGESRPFSQTVSVNYLDDPTDQDYSGSLSGTYTFMGTYQVTVPAGTYNAVLFRVKCEGKVGPAHTQDTAYYFFAPGVGVVAMITQEDVTAFWIIHIDTSIGKILTSN